MKKCKVDGCERKYSTMGFCGLHYGRFNTYGDPGSLDPKIALKHPPTCTAKNCMKKYFARGFCTKHYHRLLEHGDADIVLKVYDHPKICTVDGCEKPYRTNGLCSMHQMEEQAESDRYKYAIRSERS